MLIDKETVASHIWELTETLSHDFVKQFIGILRNSASLPDVTSIRIMRETNNVTAQDRLSHFLHGVRRVEPGITASALALGLECALTASWKQAQKQRLDVVWTGPLVSTISVRRSAAVLLELIQKAKREIVMVSFAAFRIPDALRALESSSQSGISMHFILESGDDSQGRLRQDASFAFRSLIGKPNVHFYTWPLSKRPPGALLHAKVVIVDGNTALITSANLTENAISTNLEIGILIDGGDAPKRIHDHIKGLIAAGEFVS